MDMFDRFALFCFFGAVVDKPDHPFDAEKWAEKWCTPQSLRSIKGGQGNMGRSY